MKKIKYYLLLVIVILGLSGCAPLNTLMCYEGYTTQTQLCHYLRGEAYVNPNPGETYIIKDVKTGERKVIRVWKD